MSMLEEFSDINLRECTIQCQNGLAHLTLSQSISWRLGVLLFNTYIKEDISGALGFVVHLVLPGGGYTP